MLQPRPADRPQSVAELQEALAQLPPPAAPADAGSADAWETTQLLGKPAVDAMGPTLVDLSQLQPATRVPPLPADARATVALSRSQLPTPDEATVVMPNEGQASNAGQAGNERTVLIPRQVHDEPTVFMPRQANDEPTVLMPRPDAVTQRGSTPPAPAAAPKAPTARRPGPAAAGRVEPALHDGLTPAVAGAHASSPAPPARTQRWPLAVGAAGLAGLAGLALWLGLKPAPEGTTTARMAPPAASAPVAAAASAMGPEPPASAAAGAAAATSLAQADEALAAALAAARTASRPPAPAATAAMPARAAVTRQAA